MRTLCILAQPVFHRKSILALAFCAAACGSSSGTTTAPSPAPAAPAPAPAAPAPALGPLQTVVELTSGKFHIDTSGSFAFGHSVTVPSSGAIGGPRFAWLDDKGNALPAVGHMGLFSSEYTGPPSAVSLFQKPGVPPEFVARSVSIEANAFVFDDTIILNAGTRYWFFADTDDANGRYTDGGVVDVYPGGDFYVGYGTINYARVLFNGGPQGTDVNFRLSGKPVIH